MTVLSSKVEEIIREIKTDHSLDGVKFVKAYNGRLREVPLGEILVTVGTGVETVGSFAGGFLGNGCVLSLPSGWGRYHPHSKHPCQQNQFS